MAKAKIPNFHKGSDGKWHGSVEVDGYKVNFETKHLEDRGVALRSSSQRVAIVIFFDFDGARLPVFSLHFKQENMLLLAGSSGKMVGPGELRWDYSALPYLYGEGVIRGAAGFMCNSVSNARYVFELLEFGVNEPLPGANERPVVAVGVGRDVTVGDRVEVHDALTVSDPDGDKLEYTWTLTTPKDSKTKLSDPSAHYPSFEPDVPGKYTAKVVASDGKLSAEGEATWKADPRPNHAPIAVLAEGGTLETGKKVILDGSNSHDADNDTLTYHWTLVEQPKDSIVSLSGLSSETVGFRPDVDGKYIVELTVFDGKTHSEPVRATYRAETKAQTGEEVWAKLEVDFYRIGSIGSEYVQLSNGTDQAIELRGLVVRVPTAQRRVRETGHNVYTFGSSKILQPGSKLIIRASGSEYAFGADAPLFYSNAGNFTDTVELLSEGKPIKSVTKSPSDKGETLPKL